jgi:serine/threonine-protein kinase
MGLDRIGKYDVLRKLASGGMAEVYLCRLKGEEGFEKKVAIKVIQPRLSEDRRFRELFIREARIAAALIHPNLIQVFDFGREGESHFLAMEFIEGWNLAQAISQARQRSLRIPLPVWRYWMEGILSGIGHLHSRGIVHRDISPSNVLLSRGGMVKITDFGIARGSYQEGGNPGWEGKFAYMAPEQARGEGASAASDLFAAAAISAELVLLRRIFDGGTAERTLARLRRHDVHLLDLEGVPAPVADTIRRGLSAAAGDRYPDAEAFSRAIAAAVPLSAGRGELESCWDALFPDDSGEEGTAIASSPAGKGSGILREGKEGYGRKNRNLVKAGVLIASASLSVGAWTAWKRRNPPVLAPAARTTSAPVPMTEKPARTPESGKKTPGQIPVPPGKTELATQPVSRGGQDHQIAQRVVLLQTEPVGVSVTLDDGTPLGRTPVNIDFAPWAGRKIEFRLEGYLRKSIPAEVLVNFKVFRLEMERRLGTIAVIQALPWAKVFEEDRYLGDTPIYNLPLPVGTHRLRFLNEPLGVEKVAEIQVQAGANPKVIVSLVEKKAGD